jgi:hypothetical protein
MNEIRVGTLYIRIHGLCSPWVCSDERGRDRMVVGFTTTCLISAYTT